LRKEIEEAIAATESLIEELRPAPAPASKQEPSPPTEKPKWSKENHPAFQPGYRKPGAPPPPEEPTPVSYKVNDTVLAKWVSGDKAFYPARITSITGSSADPVYYVTFKSYGNTEALHRQPPMSYQLLQILTLRWLVLLRKSQVKLAMGHLSQQRLQRRSKPTRN
jgi:survival-of-motor-neuron-related-splicing factor 30